jgi:hypothetical protein
MTSVATPSPATSATPSAMTPSTPAAIISDPETSKDIFDYDKGVLDAIKQRHDTILSFAIQNYTACGAIAFFYFTSTNKLPFWLAAVIIFILNINFSLGIAANWFVAKKLYAMHRIAIDCWMRGETRDKLETALRADADSRIILTGREIPIGFSFEHPAVFANVIPGIALLLQILGRAFRFF